MERQTLSIMKACEVVGVSRRTIYNWIAANKVEYVRTAGGSIRIFADTLWRDCSLPASRPPGPDSHEPQLDSELRLLFHRLNNQLGIILAHAELLEAKVTDDSSRARAAQVVASALDAMGTAKAIRQIAEPAGV
jgi:excisionase family DNA binding protein